MKKNKIISIAFVVILLFSVFVVSANAQDVDTETQADTVAYSGASGIESIEFRLADGPNGGIGTTLLLDYDNYLRSSSAGVNWVDIGVNRNDSVEEYYRFIITSNRVYGYANNSVYCATYINITHSVDGAFDNNVAVKEIYIHYKQYTIHPYSTVFQRPYDGNIDSTIGFSLNTSWVSRLTYRTSAVHMADYIEDGRTFYTVNDAVTNSTAGRHTTTDENYGRYVPVGVRWNYTSVIHPTYTIYNDGVRQTQTVPERYNFAVVTNAEQKITFDESYYGNFTFTDMYSISNNIDYSYRVTGGSPPVTNGGFEVGTFLRKSVENFLELQIADGFTLQSLLWVIVGIGAVFAVLFIFLGK